MKMKSEYPLAWPPNIPRQKRPRSSQFRTTLSKAKNNVEKELKLLAKDSGKKITDIVLTSNVTLDDKPDDPGVAIYFEWDGMIMAYPMDRYDKVQCNLQAIYHMLAADRTKLRHGGMEYIRAEKSGQHLQLSDGNRRWYQVLGVNENAPPEVVKQAYRTLSKKYHPDRNPNEDTQQQFKEVNKAYEYYEKTHTN